LCDILRSAQPHPPTIPYEKCRIPHIPYNRPPGPKPARITAVSKRCGFFDQWEGRQDGVLHVGVGRLRLVSGRMRDQRVDGMGGIWVYCVLPVGWLGCRRGWGALLEWFWGVVDSLGVVRLVLGETLFCGETDMNAARWRCLYYSPAPFHSHDMALDLPHKTGYT
jgi:hypothetical protein